MRLSPLRSRRALLIGVVAVVVAAPVVSWSSSVFLTGNFATVAPGVLLRSAQPDAAQLERYAREHRVRAVLNLRGEHADEAWYVEEVDAARALGLAHFDQGLSATRELSLEEMDALVETMRAAPKPLLVHCMAGADRTSLAVALFRYAVLHEPADDARASLSLRYGHFPWLWSDTDAMDRSFERYVSSRPARN